MTTLIYVNSEVKTELTSIKEYLAAEKLPASSISKHQGPFFKNLKNKYLEKNVKSTKNIVFLDAKHAAYSIRDISSLFKLAKENALTFYFIKYNFRIDQKTQIEHIVNFLKKIEDDVLIVHPEIERKLEGDKKTLGRPRGSLNKNLKLDKYKEDVQKYISLGLSKTTIAKLLNCNVVTVNNWLKKALPEFSHYKKKERKAKKKP